MEKKKVFIGNETDEDRQISQQFSSRFFNDKFLSINAAKCILEN